MRHLYLLLVLLGVSQWSMAQVEKTLTTPKGTLGAPSKLPADSVTIVKKDSLPPGDIKTTIHYSAEDSLTMNVRTKTAYLYTNAKVEYGTTQMQAEEIKIDYGRSLVTAMGRLDSLGKRVGYPLFKESGETYETKDMTYNFKSKKAKISGVITRQGGEGILRGKMVFKNEKSDLFCIDNAYTTCDLEKPHYRILAKRTKAIPGDKMVTGPFHMEFNQVPTPLGFVFGVFPSQRKSASGIIVPTYGEEGNRGFFLRDGGYFFDINDYIKLSLKGSVYSKGSSGLRLETNYNKLYHYSGAFSFNFTNTRINNKIEDNSARKDFSLTWTHSPQSKGTGRFSASVTAATSSYTSNNFIGLNTNLQSGRLLDQTSRNLSSNISYSKSFKGTPFNAGINISHNQDIQTKRVNLTLPSLSFNMANVYPFKDSESLVLKNLNVAYTMTATNAINNLTRVYKTIEGKIVDQNRDSTLAFTASNFSRFFKNAKNGVKHTIPISTSFKMMRFFTLSPSFSYSETWYTQKLLWTQDGTGMPIASDTLRGFARTYSYTTSVGINTRIYGTFLSKNKNARVRAIRHIINPSASFSFQPDFSASKYNNYQRFTVVDANKRTQEVSKSVYEGYTYGGPGAGRTASLGFGINNSLEMKVRNKKDTVDKKISLLNSFGISGGYNFLADSLKLSTLSISGNTNVLNNKLNINFSGTLDPYEYRVVSYTFNGVTTSQEKRFDNIVWKNGNLGRITNASLAFSTSLNPKAREKNDQIRQKVGQSNAPEGEKQMVMQNPDLYMDFSIPWNLSLGYNFTYTRGYNPKQVFTQSLRFSGDVSLSEKWKIQFNSGYDFKSNEFTASTFTIARDLHCWRMNLSWVPFGTFQSYMFSIGIKSSLLSSLKLDRTRNFFDNN